MAKVCLGPAWRNEPWARGVPFELGESLDNIEHDDTKPPTLPEALKEATYLLSLFSEGGTQSSDMLDSDEPSVRAEAKKTIKDLNRFIQKHNPKEPA